MRRLLRWHVWLGWAVAVPLLLWTASGLFMVARPIEEVRGTALRSPAYALPGIQPVLPAIEAGKLETLTLRATPLGPRWILLFRDGSRAAADTRRGFVLAEVGARQAAALARAYRANAGRVIAIERFEAAHPPLDLRQPRPAWRVSFDDGARFYIDADTGELLAIRTRLWRAFDLMWGLHIMDLQGREDTHHPLLIGFAALALVNAVVGTVLLFRRGRPRRARR